MNLRIFNIFLIFLFGTALMISSALAEGDSGGNKNTGLNKPNGQPIRAFMNINNISTIIKNTGISDIDVGEANSGLVYPKGSGKAAVFISGLVWGAKIEGDLQVRVGGSTYAEGLQGGAILNDGTVEDANADHVRIYRVRPEVFPGATSVDVSIEATDEHLSESDVKAQYELDWTEWPAAFGAPYFDGNANGQYDPDPASGDIPGVTGANQTIWYVANDQEPQLTQDLYGTEPLGIEMQLTCWAYSQTGALGNMFFRKYVLINKTDKLGNPQNFNDMYVSMWSDPDVGNSSDDFAGSDTTLSLSYAYNAIANDPTYNPLPPPAAGFDFFQGPLLDGVAGEDRNKNDVDDADDYAIYNGQVVGPGKINLPMTASYYFARGDANVTDPTLGSSAGADQFYNFMQGKIGLTGEFFVDPITLLPTTFTLTGDPTKGEGWVDGILIGPGDRRIGMAAGPFTMEPGDTQEVVVAEIVAGAIPGVDRLSAVGLLKYYDQIAQVAYDNFFDLPTAPPPPFVARWDYTQNPPVLVNGAAELNGEILLDWSKDNEKVLATETFNEKGYAFQGYNVYQLPNAFASVQEGVRIATYDIIDSYGKISDLVFDVTTGSVVTLPVQFGNDTGIKRFISITQDAINQIPLINGIRYYFAVTAYNYNSDPDAVPNNLENPIKILTAIPHANNPGITLGEGNGSGVEVTHSGTADGAPIVTIVDPTATTGHEYEVYFTERQEIRNAIGDWVSASVVSRNLGPNSPDTLTGSSIDIAAVYGPQAGKLELEFSLDLVSVDFDWADGISLTFPGGVTVLEAPGFDAGNGSITTEIIQYGTDSTVVNLGDVTHPYTGNGPFTGGETWSIFVEGPVPMPVDWIIYDDGYGGGPVDASGTTTLTDVGNKSRLAKYWNLKNTTNGTSKLENQSVINGIDIFADRDDIPTNYGTAADPIIDGFQINVDVGYAAPLTISANNPPLLNGEADFGFSGSNVWWSSDDFVVCDFTRFGYPDGFSSTTLPLYGGAGGTSELSMLQKDLELRFTGVLADTVINGNTLEITQSGGSIATLFGASAYDLVDHPLNPTGAEVPFTVRIPFEVWNVDDNEQVNLVFWDRSGDPTVDGGKVWNTENRTYGWVVNTPYTTDLIDITSQMVADNSTWNIVLYQCTFTTGDVLSIFYDNPIQIGIDTYSFTTTASAYSGSLAKSQIDEINVFPNPYYGINSEEVNKYNRFVTFTHLPEKANIKIFNLAGVLVRTIEKDDVDQYQRWDLANNSGLPVASGLYIAYIELPDLGETKILKVAVIQEQQILDRF